MAKNIHAKSLIIVCTINQQWEKFDNYHDTIKLIKVNIIMTYRFNLLFNILSVMCQTVGANAWDGTGH